MVFVEKEIPMSDRIFFQKGDLTFERFIERHMTFTKIINTTGYKYILNPEKLKQIFGLDYF